MHGHVTPFVGTEMDLLHRRSSRLKMQMHGARREADSRPSLTRGGPASGCVSTSVQRTSSPRGARALTSAMSGRRSTADPLCAARARAPAISAVLPPSGPRVRPRHLARRLGVLHARDDEHLPRRGVRARHAAQGALRPPALLKVSAPTTMHTKPNSWKVDHLAPTHRPSGLRTRPPPARAPTRTSSGPRRRCARWSNK
jgi:hypothetical protein